MRRTPNRVDLPRISEDTGVDTGVLRQVKSHLFRAQHDVAVGPNQTRKGLFTPRDDIAELWQKAQAGTLSPPQLREFRALMAHEYIESELMKSGMPYISDHPDLWSDDDYKLFPRDVDQAGAHDLAPHSVDGHWRAWKSLGLTPPDTVVDPGVRVEPGVAAELDDYLWNNIGRPTIERTCRGAVRWPALKATTSVKLPDLPAPYEPLLLMYERGGGFTGFCRGSPGLQPWEESAPWLGGAERRSALRFLF